MRLFKLLIPKDSAQEVTERESWTVHWWVKTGWSDSTDHHAKAFVIESEAKEFERQLIESAKFIRCWINTKMHRN